MEQANMPLDPSGGFSFASSERWEHDNCCHQSISRSDPSLASLQRLLALTKPSLATLRSGASKGKAQAVKLGPSSFQLSYDG